MIAVCPVEIDWLADAEFALDVVVPVPKVSEAACAAPVRATNATVASSRFFKLVSQRWNRPAAYPTAGRLHNMYATRIRCRVAHFLFQPGHFVGIAGNPVKFLPPL